MEECLRLEKCWAWFICLGIALMVVGLMAIGAALAVASAVTALTLIESKPRRSD